jgi:hypothetical protein
MTINPHITRALGRERTADALREAAAYRTAAAASPGGGRKPRPEPSQHQRFGLVPREGQKR